MSPLDSSRFLYPREDGIETRRKKEKADSPRQIESLQHINPELSLPFINKPPQEFLCMKLILQKKRRGWTAVDEGAQSHAMGTLEITEIRA